MRLLLFCLIGITALPLFAADYKSPYSVKFSFPDEELIGDLLKGPRVDCSNFTGFVYNLALGILPSTGIKSQSEMTDAAGPGAGAGRSVQVKRIELPKSYEDFPSELMTGDLLFVKSARGNVSHVVLWVGKIGEAPEDMPLILDSTGSGATDAKGVPIPDGVQLRPSKRTAWYFTQASHVLRIIPEDS